MKKKFLIIFLPIISLIIIISLGFCFHYENTTLKVTNYEVASKKTPTDFNDYKIMQISDFHNTRNKKLTNSIINEIKEQKPDIIVLTGDTIDPKMPHMEASFDFIKIIKDYAPIYYITGNHESHLKSYAETKKELIELGVIVLDNEKRTIEKNESKINILGIADPYMVNGKVNKKKGEVIIKSELDSMEYNDNEFNILLSHRPESFKIYTDYKMDLVFTGHAHGGQIRLPFIGGLYAPHQGLFPKYTSGTFKKDNTTMVVSRGIGGSKFPFRINNRPELVIVTLKSE